jgi:catecholate siderophore receptor
LNKQHTSVRVPSSFRQKKGRVILQTSLALGISTAMVLPLSLVAAEIEELEAVKVQDKAIDPNPNAEVGAPYKAKTSADVRRTRPIAETPQTINVITKNAIDDYGQTDLSKVLLTQPGITLGTGENGNMFGDNYNIRGQSAKSDTFIDGMRDPGMSTRETFATEQIEVTKGPNSSFAGRGSAGGAINMVTKQATVDYDFIKAAVGAGSDKYQRYTVDLNKVVNDSVALRVNALWADQDIPDRDPATRKREGIALAGLFEVSKDFSIMADFYHMKASHEYPDAGTFLVGGGTTGTARRPTSSTTLVGAQNGDFLDSNANIGSLRLRWAISPTLTLNSLTRYGKNDNAYAFYASQASGSGANGIRAQVQAHTRFQDSTYFAHQDNLRWDTDLGNGRKNEFVATIEYSDNHAEQGNYSRIGGSNQFVTGFGSNFDVGAEVANPQSVVPGFWSRGAKAVDWRVKTIAASLMDTYDISEDFTGFAGFRVDRPELRLATGLNTASPVVYKYDDTLKNYWGGLSYKLTKEGIVYLSYGTSQDINGGEPDSGTNPSYGGLVTLNNQLIAGTKPETAKNVELGTKWNLLNQKLLATAALFRTEKEDLMQTTNTAELATSGTVNSAALRIYGIEFGLVGNVTDKFSVQAGAALMHSEMTKSNTAFRANIGHQLANFANKTATVLGRYQATRDFAFGGVSTYVSERCGGQPDTGVTYTNGSCSQPVPSYTVYDLFAEYRINKNFKVRANILNAFDKEYYLAAYQAGFFLYKGDGRRGYLTLDMDF